MALFFPLFLGRYSIGRFFLFHRCHIDLITDFSLLKTTLLSLRGHFGKNRGAFWEIIHTLVSFESLVSLVSFLSFVSFVSGVSLREFWGSRSAIFKGLV